jgi:hypothetical protein
MPDWVAPTLKAFLFLLALLGTLFLEYCWWQQKVHKSTYHSSTHWDTHRTKDQESANHHATMPPCHHATMPPCHHATMPPCHHATMPPCHHATMPPCHHATNVQSNLLDLAVKCVNFQ